MSSEKEKSQGGSEEYEEKSEEDHGSEHHSYQDEEGGPISSWERDQSRREKRIRRSMPQLREDGPQKQRLLDGIGAKTKANRMANEDTPGVSMDS